MTDVSVITVTDGKNSLFTLIDSIKGQKLDVECKIRHLILWDEKRAEKSTFILDTSPFDIQIDDGFYSSNCFILKNFKTSGKSNASALRAVGLMVASTEFVTFADDDITWEDNHISSMLSSISNNQWTFCKRNIWTKINDTEFEYLGIDEFESVGEESKLPYKTINNNCLMFKRRYGTSAACLYRETQDMNDDRLMYEFLMKYAPMRSQTNMATVNQVCPDRLVKFFRDGCTKPK